MALIPKLGSGGGLIAGAASSLVGQVRGAVSREVAAVKSGEVLGQIRRAADQATGGLVSSVFGPAGGEESGGLVIGGDTAVLNVAGLSQWGGLSRHLQASIFPCDDQGNEVMGDDGGSSAIVGPATELQFDSQLNWQSPFENSGPESKAPTVMAMIQTGQIGVVANALQALAPGGSAIGEFAGDMAGKAEKWSNSLKGRTGITKLNSRQVFSGMPPVRLTMQFHLRAVSDAETEVMSPYDRLLRWAWPQRLAENGIVSEVLTSDGDLIGALFPSDAPQMVGFRRGNMRYSPMVIESISHPMDGPMGSDGKPLYLSINLTLATLTALDANDVARIYNRS